MKWGNRLKQPLVSICIPTYNRVAYLQKTLDSLVTQQEVRDGTVEVIITDNASIDSTSTLGREYADKYKNIYYFRNPVNVRDKNFPICMSYANGILRKLSNDTLMFQAGSMKSICEAAKLYQNTKPVLFFNNGKSYGVCSQNPTKNFSEFISQVSYNVTWIGGFSLWDKDCDDLLGEESLNACESSLWQVWKLCKVLADTNKGIILERQFGCVQSVKYKNISYGLYKVFYENYLGFLRPYVGIGHLSKEDFLWLEKDLLYKFFTNWIVQWEIHNPNLNYSQSENLKMEIWKTYQDKSYFSRYVWYYRFYKTQIILKEFLKKMIRGVCK